MEINRLRSIIRESISNNLKEIEDVAENNMENLKEHLKDAAEEYNFDMFIVDLRNQKNRFDDILFVFVKRIETPSEQYQTILHYLKDISQTI